MALVRAAPRRHGQGFMDPSILLYPQLGSSKSEPSPRAREAELISRRGSLQLPPRGLRPRPRPGGATVLPARPEAPSSSSSNSGSSSRGSAGRPGAGVPGARMGNQLGSHLGERYRRDQGRWSPESGLTRCFPHRVFPRAGTSFWVSVPSPQASRTDRDRYR